MLCRFATGNAVHSKTQLVEVKSDVFKILYHGSFKAEMMDYNFAKLIDLDEDDFLTTAPFQTRHNIRTVTVKCTSGESHTVPLVPLELIVWDDGFTAVSRSWMGCKTKVVDRARMLLKLGYLDIIPFMTSAGGEALVKEAWFALKRSAALHSVMFTTPSTAADPNVRVYAYPPDSPRVAINLVFVAVSGDHSELSKECGLVDGKSSANRPGVFDDVNYGEIETLDEGVDRMFPETFARQYWQGSALSSKLTRCRRMKNED